MKLLLSVIAVAVLLQATHSAPYRAAIQDLLDQLRQTKRAQEQADYGYSDEQDYNYGEMQQDNIGDYGAKEMQDIGYEQDYYGNKEDYYGNRQDYYGNEQDYYGNKEDYGYDTDMATIEREFDAAMQGWWDSLKRAGRWMWNKAKVIAKHGCRLYNSMGSGGRKVDTEQIPVDTLIRTGVTVGKKLLNHACKYIAKPKSRADIEGWFGITFNRFKNAAKKLFDTAKKGCKTYSSNPLVNKGAKYLAGSKSKYLDTVCKGLNSIGGRQAAFEMIFKRALRETVQQAQQEELEERMGRAFIQSFVE